MAFFFQVRSSVAFTIAAIGHWDWPEAWPDLFDIMMAALADPDEFAVQGAVRVLKEFSRDLTDTQEINNAIHKGKYLVFIVFQFVWYKLQF